MSVDEHSPQESSQEPAQPAVRVVSGYCATRRTARKHKRVIRQGTELFDADGNTLAVFAMPPHEAATVLQAQEYSAIIAIVSS